MAFDDSGLKGKVAVVTGASMGIGRAIAVDLAAAGADVVVADRDGGEQAAAELREAGHSALGASVDVADEDAVAAAMGLVTERLGGVDILVNNAGIFAPLVPGPFERISVDEWRRVMDVNVMGTFLMARAVVGSMRERGGGRIVNMASTTPFKGVANIVHYTASKGAVVALTRALAKELGTDGILVNAVAPGFTVSDGVNDHPDAMEAMRRNAPGGRVLQREMAPDDIVGAVGFLVSPRSSFVTGQTIVVDGGAYFH